MEIPDDDDDDRDGEKVRVPTFNDVGGDLSQAEAEKALRELMSGAITEDVEIDAEDAIVPGLKDGFRLLPHQIQGRNWMRGREDIKGKRYGGILADDMGYVASLCPLTLTDTLEQFRKDHPDTCANCRGQSQESGP